jgi:BRO1-like domain
VHPITCLTRLDQRFGTLTHPQAVAPGSTAPQRLHPAQHVSAADAGARRAATASSPVGSDVYSRYMHALRAVEIRFPVSADGSHVNVAFKWHDAFVDRDACSQKNIHFEKAGVLFCMGALESQRGAEVNRDSQAGIAEAIKAFSLAAGARAGARYLLCTCSHVM